METESPDKLLKIFFIHVDIGTLIHNIYWICFNGYKSRISPQKEKGLLS